ncbi:hypothetical protein EDO6_03114 [Paenibacillus xylanexedens]|nr:hypothetical protein EDO6_03114 [Paenibacillus xylanexedens]
MAYSLVENRISLETRFSFMFYEGGLMFISSQLGTMRINAEHATES